MKINKKGFTLIEILVVVLIIGILASIALPQYRRAVTKAKVASVLPLLRAWSQALMVYKLENDSYCPDGVCPNAKDLDVYWPSDWKKAGTNEPCGNNTHCASDYWFECRVNPVHGNHTYHGEVECAHAYTGYDWFYITIYPPDFNDGISPESLRGKITCLSSGEPESIKTCEYLGGELLSEEDHIYVLNF